MGAPTTRGLQPKKKQNLACDAANWGQGSIADRCVGWGAGLGISGVNKNLGQGPGGCHTGASA